MLTESTPRVRARAVVVGLVGLWLCWGTSLPAMRVMVATMPPLLASGVVFLVAGLALGATTPTMFRGLTARQFRSASVVGLMLLVAQGTVAVAVQHVFASTAAVLVAMIPLWVVVLRLAVGDRPDRAGVLRLGVGFLGVVVVVVADDGGGRGWSWWALVVVAAALCWAGGTLVASRSSTMPGTRAVTVVQLVVGGLALVVAAAADGEFTQIAWAAIGSPAWMAFGYLVAVDSLAGFALFTWLLRVAPVSLVSTYSYAVPVVAYLVGVLVLGEPFRPLVLLGAAVVIAAVTAEVVPRPG